MVFSKKLTKLCIRASFLFPVILGSAQEKNSCSIDVSVNGIHSSKGEIVICLFNKEDGFPNQEKAFKVISVKIDERRSNGQFPDLFPGDYAIAVYHDENGNKKLDRNFLGIPREGVGASNNAKGHFGPPKYRDAMFSLTHESKNIPITITYL